MCIHYDGGRVAANETLIAEISARGLRRTTRDTGLDRKTIRAVLNGEEGEGFDAGEDGDGDPAKLINPYIPN